MQKTCWLLAVSMLLSLAAAAQAGLNNADLQDITLGRQVSAQNLNKSNADDRSQLAYEDKQTDHYYTPVWLPGSFTRPSGAVQSVPGLRYNLLKHWVEVQDAAVPGQVRVYPADALRGFMLSSDPSQPTYFAAYLVRGEAGRQQLQELTPPGSGPLHLLVRHEVELQPAVRNVATNMETQPAQLLHTARLYAATAAPGQGQAEATELALTKKAVLRLFGPVAPTLVAYAQQQQLSFSDTNDVLKLVEHYNALAATPGAAK